MIKSVIIIISLALVQTIILIQIVPGINVFYPALICITGILLTWVIASRQNITDRIRAEKLLAHEKEVSDKIINSLPGIFYLYDRDRQFIRWNKNFEMVSGYPSEAFSKLQPLDFFEAEDKELLNNKIDAVFRNGEDEVEANLVTHGKRKIPYYFNGSLANFDGKDYLIGMGIDITCLKVAEKKVLKAYAEKEVTLNRISDAVVSLDPEWRYTFLNDAALATHPEGRAGTLGKTIIEVHPELVDTPFWSMYQESMHLMKVMQTESYYAPMDTWFSAMAYPSPSGLTIFYQDITQRKIAEQQKLDLIVKLQTKNKDLRQFSYIVSHNLRAPIAKISGLGELLREISDGHHEIIELIVKETKQLDHVVMDLNAILAARRSDQVTIEQVDFLSTLEEVKKSIQHEIDETGSVISTAFEVPGLFTIKGYINVILFNLISNAIKFRKPNTPPRIQITTKNEGDFVCLSVIDNGRGIDLEKHKEKLFTLYRRFHENNVGGRGVGLMLVKTHAETLGGHVKVESNLNEGTTFKIYLPAKYIASDE